MRYKDSESKLKHARKLFEDLVDHYETAHAEAHRASRFYHNTDCQGQWEQEDLDYLRKNERLALTFNMIRTKINTFLGMYADAQRVPIVAATGSDTLAAEVIDAVKEQVLKDANYQSLAARQLKSGTVDGECSLHIEVLPSDDGPEWVKVVLHRVLSVETLWDKASVEPDRSDARHVFWYRWLDEDEFKSEYPDFADEFAALKGSGSEADEDMQRFGEMNSGDTAANSFDYSSDTNNRYYYDRRENKVRVIRYEYKHLEKVKYATNLETGEKIKLEDEKIKRRVDTAIALGHPMQINEVSEEPTKVCEFIGSKLLAEYDEAGPFQGFSLVPYAYEVDDETGTPYGLARDLFDPQMELNKSRSLDLELTAQATTPGTIAEVDAIPDRKAYELERRRPNGVALVAKGALSEGSPKVIERQATPPSAIAAQRSQAAMELMNEVSGIPSNSTMVPAEQAQAGITVAIRYHKSRQTVSTPFSHFEQAQKNLVQKVTEVIVNVMPDDQITALLGSREDFKVVDGRVVELEAAPVPPQMGPVPGLEGPGQPPGGPPPGMPMPMGQGMQGMPGPQPGLPPMVPKRVADLTSIRQIKWHLDMEYTSENSTLRMLELDILMQLANAGIAVDPEVMIERATNSRSVRERLKKYLDKAQQAQAAGSKAESDALRAQGEGMIKIEAAKVEETARHNKETEKLDAIEIMMKNELEKMKIYADADDTEKGHLLEVVKMAAQTKMQREKLNSGGING